MTDDELERCLKKFGKRYRPRHGYVRAVNGGQVIPLGLEKELRAGLATVYDNDSPSLQWLQKGR